MGKRWGPLEGQLFSLSFGRCTMLQTLRETVGDVVQGGTVQWPLNFESGVMRGRFSPHDGQLYVSGLKGWVSSAARDGCLQRVRYTGGKVHLPIAAKTMANGLQLTFSEPLDREYAEDVGNYSAEAWNYRYGAQYGSPEFKVSDAQAEGRDTWAIASATLSDDGRSVFLEIPQFRPVMQLAISWQLHAATGEALNHTLNYTVNALGSDRGQPASGSRRPRPGQLPPEVQQRLVPGVKWQFNSVVEASTADDAQADFRIDPLAALYVAHDEAVSSRIAAKPFRATAVGYLQSSRNADAQFQLRGRGAGELRVNGKLVATLGDDSAATAETTPVRLRKGFNQIEIDYRSPKTGDAALRLYWSGNDFAWETVSPELLWADPLDKRLQQAEQWRAGRELFATRRCAACHQLSRDTATVKAMPELQLDAPRLTHVGQRLNRNWIYRWLLDPQALRNHTTMPRLFNAEIADDRQAAADIAAYLTTLADDKSPQPAKTGEEDAGLALYENLGCIQCHHFSSPSEDDEFHRVSLQYVAAKFKGNAALAEFLRSPHRHFTWSRMPDFHLSDKEAHDLAQFLHSRSSGECKESDELNSADAERGKLLFTQRSCQQCHAVDRDGTTASAKLASVLGTKALAGCLAEPESRQESVPDLALSAEQRSALLAFCRSEKDSLARPSAAENAHRLMHTLRCSACHSRQQRNRVLDEESELGHAPELIPSLTWAGEKLRVDWISKQIGGELDFRARPWLSARMPDFGPYAAPLAAGMAANHGLSAAAPAESIAMHKEDESARIGERLTHKEGGLDCRLCHALGHENLQLDNRAQGIGFSLAGQRLREEYYHRWMRDPLRIDPQIAMPRFSADGVTTKVNDVLDGDARRQFEAIWDYLQRLSVEPSGR